MTSWVSLLHGHRHRTGSKILWILQKQIRVSLSMSSPLSSYENSRLFLENCQIMPSCLLTGPGDESPRDWTPVKQVIGSWVGIWPRLSLSDSSPGLLSQSKMEELSFLSGISKLGRYDSGTPSDHPAQGETFCKIKSCRGKQGWAMERELEPCWYSGTSRSNCIWIWLHPWISSTCLLRLLLLFGFCF